MTQDRPAGSPVRRFAGAPVPGPRPGGDDRHDDLAERIGAADARSGVVTPFARRAGTVAITGVVASALGMVGAGATAAANPYTDFAAAVDGVAHAVGVDWSSMPDGFTREQHDAFWGAGFSAEDQLELAELWSLDTIEVKARAGQMVLDGERLPFKPGTHTAPEPSAQDIAARQAFIDSGHTSEDLAALSALWNVDETEAKVRAGEILLVGKPLPLP